MFTAEDVASRVAEGVKDPETFSRLFAEAMTHPDLLIVSDERSSQAARLYSTGPVIEAELAVLDRGAMLATQVAKGAQRISEGDYSAVARRFGLDETQAQALRHSAEDQLSIISGGSGSGKTRVSAAVAVLHKEAGRKVIRVAPTRVGVEVLKAEGAADDVRTVASLLWMIENERTKLDSETVLVLDDAGKLGAGTTERLLTLLDETGAQLVALRDTDQLGPMEASNVFDAMERRVGGLRLTGQHRSRSESVTLVHDALAPKSTMGTTETIAALCGADLVKAGGARQESIERLGRSYAEDVH